VKKLLNKKLSIKQVLAIIVLLIGVFAVLFIFSNKGEPVLIPKIVQKIKKQDTVKVPVIDTSAFGRLKTYVDSINNAAQLYAGEWSFYLSETDSANVLFNINSNKVLVPASTLKIVTTGTAMAILGGGYRMVTRVQYDGNIDAATKILNGNIYITGGGDPSLGSEVFGSSLQRVINDWTFAIKKLGIDSINGAVIADVDAFEREPIPISWAWQDMQCDYGAGLYGLNINENVFHMTFNVGKDGKTFITTKPNVPGLKLYNQSIYNPNIPKSYAYVQGSPYQFNRTVFGEVLKNHVERAALPDPPLFCAQLLAKELKANKIRIKDSASTTWQMKLNNVKVNSRKERKLITATASPELRKLVYHTNQISQNFYAENILRAISLHQSGYSSSHGSVNEIYRFWKEKNVDLRGICMVDGSGLSRMNTISTHQLVDMLNYFAKDSAMSSDFYNSLPVAGVSGTLRRMADSTLAEGNLHAKSGSMTRVKSYAGYLKTKSGKSLTFAVIANNTLWDDKQLKQICEKLFSLMADLP